MTRTARGGTAGAAADEAALRNSGYQVAVAVHEKLKAQAALLTPG
jgi:hypothetical protein